MANVLALISQSGFNDLERQHGAIALESTKPVTAYHSKNKRLQSLAEGGSLFMVAVRDEQLWRCCTVHVRAPGPAPPRSDHRAPGQPG